MLEDINCATIEDGIRKVLTSVKWSPISFDSDQSSCYKIVKSGFGEVLINFDPTILEDGPLPTRRRRQIEKAWSRKLWGIFHQSF